MTEHHGSCFVQRTLGRNGFASCVENKPLANRLTLITSASDGSSFPSACRPKHPRVRPVDGLLRDRRKAERDSVPALLLFPDIP